MKDRLHHIGGRRKLSRLDTELATRALLISKNNEFLILLLERLEKLNLVSENNAVHQEICTMIDLIRHHILDKNLEQLERLYVSGNTGFMKNLLMKHPDLTANERRLCMLLHTNMSTKEISEMTMQSCRAIEMTRHRIRRKFGLQREDNLVSYLTQFMH